MRFYPEGTGVEVVVNFTDDQGAAVEPTRIDAVLYDGEGDVLETFENVQFEAEETSTPILIPALYNNLEDGETRAARVLRIEIHTAGGIIRRSHKYAIEAEQRLELMVNTFMTYETAEIVALDIPNLTGWATATEDARKGALVEAFRRITMLPMKYAFRDVDGRLMEESERHIARDVWPELTADDFAEFPRHFRQALRRAQVIEANELLQGDNLSRKRRAGIVTETIGESSMTLRTDRVDYGMSPQTLATLTGYIHFNMRIARA